MALPRSLLNFSCKYTVLIPIAVVGTICFFQFQTAFVHIIMASFFTWLGRLVSFLTRFGRFAFFGLITSQYYAIILEGSRPTNLQGDLVLSTGFVTKIGTLKSLKADVSRKCFVDHLRKFGVHGNATGGACEVQ